MNTLSFEVNNGRKMELVQRKHDGKILIHVEDKNGNIEVIPDREAFIEPGEMVMLINYFRNCKNGTETGDYIKRWGEQNI